MPHRHTVRKFVRDGSYHVYNRGVEKRNVFLDDQDYNVFLHLLKYYLSPGNKEQDHPTYARGSVLVRPRPLSKINKKVKLAAYCLMPNHYHLLLKQVTEDGVTMLMRRLATTYSMYFNRRYNRVGYLFQGRYKASTVDSDAQLIYLSKYIHLNPVELTRFDLVNLEGYRYSSYNYYLGKKGATWLKSEIVMDVYSNFSKVSYKDFVMGGADGLKRRLKRVAID